MDTEKDFCGGEHVIQGPVTALDGEAKKSAKGIEVVAVEIGEFLLTELNGTQTGVQHRCAETKTRELRPEKTDVKLRILGDEDIRADEIKELWENNAIGLGIPNHLIRDAVHKSHFIGDDSPGIDQCLKDISFFLTDPSIDDSHRPNLNELMAVLGA